MEMKHLSDEQIQDYLDGNLLDEEKIIQNHLTKCLQCLQEIEVYKAIYSEAQNDLGVELSAGFTDKLTAEIAELSKPTLLNKLQSAALSAAAILSIVSIFIYFFNYKAITNSVLKIIDLDLLSSLMQIVKLDSSVTSLIVTCLLGLLMIILVDQLYKHRRNKSTLSIFSI